MTPARKKKPQASPRTPDARRTRKPRKGAAAQKTGRTSKTRVKRKHRPFRKMMGSWIALLRMRLGFTQQQLANLLTHAGYQRSKENIASMERSGTDLDKLEMFLLLGSILRTDFFTELSPEATPMQRFFARFSAEERIRQEIQGILRLLEDQEETLLEFLAVYLGCLRQSLAPVESETGLARNGRSSASRKGSRNGYSRNGAMLGEIDSGMLLERLQHTLAEAAEDHIPGRRRRA